VAQFLEDVKEGKVEKHIDTEKDKKEKEVKYVNVLKLTAENYNQTLADNRVVFVEYYSPNCGHCVRFAPEYEKLATKVKEEGLGFVVAAADLVT
jgi:thiol-disulfide isomerase/thioredoxin